MYRINLKNVMDIRKVTQCQMSEDLGINRQFINSLANGRVKSLKVESLQAICKYLNVPVQELIYFEVI